MVTLTTVGYGDAVPTTVAVRLSTASLTATSAEAALRQPGHRAARRRGGGGAMAHDLASAREAWTPAHAELEASLSAMGFTAAAARRGALRVCAAPGGRDPQLGEAIEWLSSLPPGEADAPFALPAEPPVDAEPTPAPAVVPSDPVVKASANPWAALLDDSD